MRPISQLLANDIIETVRAEYSGVGVINVPALAEAIRVRNEIENFALEDIAEKVMNEAVLLGAPIEFYTPPTPANHLNGGSLRSREEQSIVSAVRGVD